MESCDFKCRLCEKNIFFTTSKTVINHVKQVHKYKEQLDEFPCCANSDCSKTFLLIASLKKHMKKCCRSR